MSQITTELQQFLAHRIEFKQPLAQFQLHWYEGRNNVDHLTSFFQVEGCRGNTLRHSLHERHHTLEVADHVTLNRLCLVILFLRIWLQCNMSHEVGFFLRKLANLHALQALHSDLKRAIRHTEHAAHTNDLTDFEDLVWSRLLDLSSFLCIQSDKATTAIDIVTLADGALLASGERVDSKRVGNS